MAPDTPTIELSTGELLLALRDPRAAHEVACRRLSSERTPRSVEGFHVVRPSPPLPLPPPDELWGGDPDALVLETARELVALLDGFEGEQLEAHVSLLPLPALQAYLMMNVVRVVRVVEALRRRGVQSGRLLEVGSWFGSFALALRRLGYEVVACDRYGSYAPAFDRYVDLLRREGVEVLSTTRARELDEIRGAGSFDVVLAAAVIEHVPHTPRLLLDAMFSVLRPGGLLVLDTPNVARYWNRRALERGETIFQPLQQQYSSEPPWEGHHREYVASELAWMLEQVGCIDIEVEFLDYNMLQFDELSAEHVECLATIVEDPEQADILLGVGARPSVSADH